MDKRIAQRKEAIRVTEKKLGKRMINERRALNDDIRAFKILISENTPPPTMNVYKKDLQSCSQKGRARTGFVRDGKCTNHQGDAGSHHVCIDVSDVDGNFCTATGQPDWCSKKSACHDDPGKSCPIENWCVCEWAFADYVDKKGCDNIATVDCEATNHKVIEHYQDSSSPSVQNALACLKKKCNLE